MSTLYSSESRFKSCAGEYSEPLGPLSWTIGCANGLHQRPISVLLTVFAPMVLAQKHPVVMVSGEKLQFK